jgi:cytochrome b
MVRVWDGPTRAFHWLLALLVLNAWLSFEFSEHVNDHTMLWHRLNGYSILVLVVFRLIWGFVGSSTSRFRLFVRGPAAAARYAIELVMGRGRHYLGHNPLGTVMVLALLIGVAVQGVLGLFNSQLEDGTVSGPLSSLWPDDWVRKFRVWHRQGFYYLLLTLIGVHVLANVLYAVVRHEPLVKAMITGKKPRGSYADATEASIADKVWLRALVCLVVAAAIVLAPLAIFGRNVV